MIVNPALPADTLYLCTVYFQLCEFMFMICTKIDVSNGRTNITGITLFPDEELFLLALYFTLLQQPLTTPTFSAAF